MLDFFRSVGKLKTIPRQGWVDRGVPSPESVAEHTLRSVLMAWLLGEKAGLDTVRLIKLMLVHDLPEAEVGDATPYADVLGRGAEVEAVVARWRELLTEQQLAAARQAKQQAEAEAMEHLAAGISDPLGAELLDLWRDYSERRSAEAQFAAQIDKLEALLQAIEYREAGHEADVASFLKSAREEVEHPVLLELLAELEAAAGQAPAVVSFGAEAPMSKRQRKVRQYYLENIGSMTREEIEAWFASIPTAAELNWEGITAIAPDPDMTYVPGEVAAHHHNYVAEAYESHFKLDRPADE